MRIELPEHVKIIIEKLEAHGHEAYAVGGCVRDTMLGRVPGDWDITTSAKPEQIKEDTTATSRCMPFAQETLSEKCVCCGRPAKSMVYWGKAY